MEKASYVRSRPSPVRLLMAFAARPDPAIAAPILRRRSGEASLRARVNEADRSGCKWYSARAAALRTSTLGSSNDFVIKRNESSPLKSARSAKAAARSDESALCRRPASSGEDNSEDKEPSSRLAGTPLSALIDAPAKSSLAA